MPVQFLVLEEGFCLGKIETLLRDGEGRECKLTESSPHLPRHDQTTTDKRRGVLRRKYRHRDLLQTHANTQQHTGRGKLAPGLRDGHAEGREEREDSRDEDDAAAAEEVVEGIGDPAGTVFAESVNERGQCPGGAVSELGV